MVSSRETEAAWEEGKGSCGRLPSCAVLLGKLVEAVPRSLAGEGILGSHRRHRREARHSGSHGRREEGNLGKLGKPRKAS